MSAAEDRWSEKMEAAFQVYARVRDLETALLLSPLSDEERARARTDAQLLAQVLVADAQEHETILAGIVQLSDSAQSESVKLSALTKRGELFYPEKFQRVQKHEVTGKLSVSVAAETSPEDRAKWVEQNLEELGKLLEARGWRRPA